ncbi:SpoIIE family protein phosphatase [Streptomyces sp. F63]|uniref:SpoIIE family protein phosphatase n=1 Tax=Streptomyces sp. F63 TaxID=2824887 RepID=UPI001B38CB95|nr:SpoIIE family protein phosphatase [Streptomyces sp. F63]MBQ0986422.1 SpoIIE family protein phosphatase [Streptomyces sp. F63]
MASAHPPGLLRRLPLLLRSRDPQAMLGVLTGGGENGGEPAPLAPERTRIYVRGAGGVDVFSAGSGPEPGSAPAPGTPERGYDEAVGEVMRTGRPLRLGDPDTPVVLLPLAADGRVAGVLAAGLRPGDAAPGSADGPALELLAETCAVRLNSLAHRSVELLAEAAQATRTGVFAWDLARNSVRWDEQACAIYGVDPDEFTGEEEAFFGSLHPDDLPVVQAAIAEVTEAAVTSPGSGTAGDPGAYRLHYRVVHPDGSHHPVLEHGRVVMGEDGRPARALGLVLRSPPGMTPAMPSLSPDRSRDAFLFSLTRALSKAVTVRDVTRVMTDLTRPALGAANVTVGVVEHGELTIVGRTPVPPELRHLHAPARRAMELAMRQEEPLFLEDLRHLAGTGVPELSAAGPIPPRAWVVLSLSSSERPTGACLISFTGPRHFDPGERTFYTAVAAILTQSIERARMFDSEHQRASELQQAMLPRGLPRLPSLSTRARYLPGTSEMNVGGDWYDVLPLADGTAALVIGDVQGHDAHAAAVMGQLRVVLRTCAEAGMNPGSVLARANRVLGDLDTGRFATCAYLVLDPSDGSLEGARAGHPHPLLVTSGATGELRLTGGPPLGVVPHARYPTTRARLADDETLILFTDGLVERKGADIEACVARMREDLRGWMRTAEEERGGPVSLEAITDFLLREDGDPWRSDDIALLAVRRTGEPPRAGPEFPRTGRNTP